MGGQALASFTTGITSLAVAVVAWRRVHPMYHAASTETAHGALAATDQPCGDERSALLTLRDVAYSYPGRERPALSAVDLEIRLGDRLLVVGPSGGGKSTLSALLAALCVQESGLVLCRGLDLATLGADRWRESVVMAPQFHDNHVLAATFAFNLLMGRRWPATAADLAEAEALCRELGLGDLLDRMPSGMMQVVGDTGWQLSHGERSRLFVARALLQEAKLVILDESLGPLDPANVERSLECARRRAPTLAVVAHP
jgi:ATP-binding cassette subfamily B protein